MKKYRQLTLNERYHIKRLKQAGHGISHMALVLGRSPATVSREIERNTGQNGYQPEEADKFASSRRYRLGCPQMTADMVLEFETKLRDGLTPAIISCRARAEGRRMVSHERIYQHVIEDAARGGVLWRYLPRSHRRRKKRCWTRERRGRITNQKMIDRRPEIVENRGRLGDWEGDLVQGKNGHLVSLVERRSRYVLLGKVSSKHEKVVRHRMKRLLMSVPSDKRKTLTLDNGKEFSGHEKLSADAGIDIYFAHPYHSWERGSNENANGLIRRWFPKGSDFSKISDREIGLVQDRLNERPRARLEYLTASEVFLKRQLSPTWPLPLWSPGQSENKPVCV